MPEQPLEFGYRSPLVQVLEGKGVPQGLSVYGFGQPGRATGIRQHCLHPRGLQLRPHRTSRNRVHLGIGGRENILPAPAAARQRVFLSVHPTQFHLAPAPRHFLTVPCLQTKQMRLQSIPQARRQTQPPDQLPLRIAHHQAPPAGIDIAHPNGQ